MLEPKLVTLIHFCDFQKEEVVFRANEQCRGCVLADSGSADLVMPSQISVNCGALGSCLDLGCAIKPDGHAQIVLGVSTYYFSNANVILVISFTKTILGIHFK